jgi:hypothetical protein
VPICSNPTASFCSRLSDFKILTSIASNMNFDSSI